MIINNEILILFLIVPLPMISIDAANTQTVGESLTLKCSVTTVRGITSRVDIVWSSNGSILNGTEGVIVNSTTDKSMLFVDYYTISKLRTADKGRVLQCEVKISANVYQLQVLKILLLDVNA